MSPLPIIEANLDFRIVFILRLADRSPYELINRFDWQTINGWGLNYNPYNIIGFNFTKGENQNGGFIVILGFEFYIWKTKRKF